MRKRSLAFAGSLLAGALLVSCTGGTSPDEQPDERAEASAEATPEGPTPDEFIAQADEICVATAKKVAANEEQYTPKTTEKQSMRIEQQTARLAEERLAALEELEAPEELSADYDRYLALRREALSGFERYLAAWKKGDMRKRNKIGEQLDRTVDRLSEVGEDIGFGPCANRLPTADRKDVESTLVRYFKNPMPAVCKKVFTKDLLAAINGPQGCGPDVLTPSKKVNVKEIEGVEGIRAGAEVTTNAHRGTVFEVTLLYEAGGYKIDRYDVRET